MKDIYIRTITGIIFLVTIIGSILVHPLAFFGVNLFFSTLALNEFFILSGQKGGRKKHVRFFILGILIYSLTGLIGIGYLDIRFAVFILPFFLLVILFELFNKSDQSWKTVGTYLTAFAYISIPFGMMNALFIIPGKDSLQTGVLIGMFVIVWSSDVFAYLVGSMFGKHRLMERISPKKSWEGSIGGLIFALAAAYVLSLVNDQLNLVQWMIMAIIIVVFGTLGDLAESMLKRQANVKDSGNLFPGHGGVLDRFDAVIFATPFVYVYLNLFAL